MPETETQFDCLAPIYAQDGRLQHTTLRMPEPLPDEQARVRTDELCSGDAALQFAYLPEALRGNSPNESLSAPTYEPIHEVLGRDDGTVYFRRYHVDPESPSLGLVLTDISLPHVERHDDGTPVLFQMGPEKRRIGIAQRVEFFSDNQNDAIHRHIGSLEADPHRLPPRPIRTHAAVERGLDIVNGQATRTLALEQVGYRKHSSDVLVSRDPRKNDYLLNRIGRYPRRIILGGSMPPATGGVDSLVTMAVAHMATFVPRNSLFNGSVDRQIRLATRAKQSIGSLAIPELWKERSVRNIGASLGIDDPEETRKEARRLYEEAGIKLFRIYTIGSDPRVLETARRLREDPVIGNDIEIFVGQVPDKALARRLVRQAGVDALIYGHGGGRQCTSAENGMGVTTLEELYEVVTDQEFSDTTILVEGGVGRNIGSLLILGVDGILYNGRIIRGTMESPAGDIFVRKNDSGKFAQPYPGSASAETQLIESRDPAIRLRRTNKAGRIHTEGSAGFTTHENKAGGSMVFWLDSLYRDAARMFADEGVHSMGELRQKLADPHVELLRIVSPEARAIGAAYKNG